MRVTKIKKSTLIRKVCIMLLCVGAGWYLKARLTPQVPNMSGMDGGTPYVLTKQVKLAEISPKKSYIGRVEAIKSVDLKPQITGYVEKVLFKEGGLVNEGDILFIIEQKRYLANVELRQAELDSAKANLVKTERDYKRQKSLSKQNYASKATLDTSESNYLQAKAAVAQAEANLELAKIDLDYTEIKAPFTGYIGKANITEGNYVTSSSDNLARIVQVSPIRVSFAVTDKDMLEARQANMKEITMQTELVLPNGQILTEPVQSVFSGNEIDSQTATINIYAEYENAQKLLIPGNYIDIKVGDKEPQLAILVPQAALAQDENGNYVVVVDDKNIAEQRRVVLGDPVEDYQIVLEGLSSEDKVIIQGLQKVKNGQEVKAQLVTDTQEAK